VGERGEVFRGVRASNTFTASSPGRLYLASYFPGEWASRTGDLATPNQVYDLVSGAMTVAVVRWSAEPDAEPLGALRRLAAHGDVNGLIAGEIDRLANPIAPPEGWEYLWFIGPAEIYRPRQTEEHGAVICCRTHRDVGLLIKDSRLRFEPGVRLRWSWKMDALPSEVAEDTLAHHDYLSIAIEFDNGQDLTYYWSSSLPVGTSYRCPIPTWAGRETHVVVRSGREGLGVWRDEEQDVYADYARAVGGPSPGQIVRVWLIAVSLFQGKEGRCQYSNIALLSGDEQIAVS
jgi:hypothetical protein